MAISLFLREKFLDGGENDPADISLVAGHVSAGILSDLVGSGQTSRSEGLIHSHIDGMKLVVAGHLLGKLAAVGVFDSFSRQGWV